MFLIHPFIHSFIHPFIHSFLGCFHGFINTNQLQLSFPIFLHHLLLLKLSPIPVKAPPGNRHRCLVQNLKVIPEPFPSHLRPRCLFCILEPRALKQVQVTNSSFLPLQSLPTLPYLANSTLHHGLSVLLPTFPAHFCPRAFALVTPSCRK